MNERISIGRINGAEIYAVKNESGEIYVPVKPICQAMGVSYPTQLEKLKGDPTFSEATIPLRGTVAADGKDREMMCLPLMLVYLWLGSINPVNVAEETKPTLIKYRLECAQILYDHFTGSMRRAIDENKAEIEMLKKINSAISDEKEAKARRKKAEEQLSKIRAARLDTTQTLFD